MHLVRWEKAAQVIAQQSALLLPRKLLRGVQLLVDARIGGRQMGEVVSGQWQTQSLIRDRGGWRARQILVVIVGAGVGLLMLLLCLVLLLLEGSTVGGHQQAVGGRRLLALQLLVAVGLAGFHGTL